MAQLWMVSLLLFHSQNRKNSDFRVCTSIVIRHLLDCVAMLADVHDGDPWDLPQTTLQVSVARGHYVALMLEGEIEAGWVQYI